MKLLLICALYSNYLYLIGFSPRGLMQVTVNSGGVVFYAMFNNPSANDDLSPREAAAVIKFASSRMATQSERLGYEFAKWLGVRTPIVRNSPYKFTFLYFTLAKFLLLSSLFGGCCRLG